MRRKTIQRLAHAARAVLLGGAVLAAATAAVWHWRPTWVGRVEQSIVDVVLAPYRQQWQAAQAARAESPERARKLMTELAAALEFVRPGDRLAPILVECLRHLTDLSDSAGDPAAAADWCRRWVDFEDRNMHAHARLGELLCKRNETRADGLTHLRDVWRQVPGNLVVTPVLVRGLLLDQRFDQALDVLMTSLRSIKSNIWLVLWDDGNGFDLRRRRGELVPRRVENGELELRFTIDDSVTGLQFRPPPFASMVLERPRVDWVTATGSFEVDLRTGELSGLRHHPDGIAAYGRSGHHVTLSPPASLPKGRHEFAMRAKVRETIPDRLLNILLRPDAEPMFTAFEGAGDESKLAILRALRARAVVASHSLRVYWRSAGESSFTAERSASAEFNGADTADGAEFDVRTPIRSTVDVLRIDLPGVRGVHYRIDAIDRYTADSRHSVSLDEIRRISDATRDGDDFLVTGSDPYFLVAVSGVNKPTVDVRIRGAVR